MSRLARFKEGKPNQGVSVPVTPDFEKSAEKGTDNRIFNCQPPRLSVMSVPPLSISAFFSARRYTCFYYTKQGKRWVLELTEPVTVAEAVETMPAAVSLVTGMVECQDEQGRTWMVGDAPNDPAPCNQCGGLEFWCDPITGWQCRRCNNPPVGYYGWSGEGEPPPWHLPPQAGTNTLVLGTPRPEQSRKPTLLADVGITQYVPKPVPEFTLESQTAPRGPESAVATLKSLGYGIHYHRETESAETAIRALLARNPKLLGLDIETAPLPAFRHDLKAALDPYKGTIRLIQIADPVGSVHVFDITTLPTAILQPLWDIPCIAHNAGFEYRFLKQAGIPPVKLHCSYLMSRLVEGTGLSLAAASSKRLGLPVDKTHQVADWSSHNLSQEQVAYAGLDAVLTLRLWEVYGPLIKETGQSGAYKRFAQVIPIIGDQMLAGVGFDSATHKTMMQAWRDELEPLREQLGQELGNVNPDSPQQLAGWLTRNLDTKTLSAWPKTPSGQLSTGADTLAGMDHPAIATLKRYSELTKQLSTFGVGYASHIHPVTGRIHADFGVAGTRGGRFSCRNPNLQNAPRDPAFRALFTARPGYQLIVADYSQIELRIAAILADDPVMLSCYSRGDDLHRRTAAALAGIPESAVTKQQRQLAKAVNFGLVYGMQAKSLAAYAKASYGVDMALKDAEKAHATYFKTYSGIKLWHAKTKAKGFSSPQVRTQGGLMRDFSLENGFQLTAGLNTPTQGSGAESLVEALLRLPEALAGLDARLILHVHDEIVLEASEQDVEAAKVALTESMVAGFLAIFPNGATRDLVEAHAGPDWQSAKG